MAIGLVGSFLLARSSVNLARPLLPAELTGQLKLDQYYKYYVAGTALLLVLLRLLLVRCRDKKEVQYELPSYHNASRNAPRGGARPPNGKKVAPSPARPPQRPTPGKKAGKGMY